MQQHTQKRLVAEIEQYLETSTTAMAPELYANPVASYADADHLADEREVLFRRLPLVVGHSSQCREAGDFFTHEVAGVPLIVSRQRDGSLRAFLNVSRHRGAQIMREECGHRTSFTCPYHAWGYRSDGSLASIPYENGFWSRTTSASCTLRRSPRTSRRT